MKFVPILPGWMGLWKLKLSVVVLISIVSFPSVAREKSNSVKEYNSALARNDKTTSVRPQLIKPIQLADNRPQESNINPDSLKLASAAAPHQLMVPQWLNGLKSPDTLKTEQDSTVSNGAIRDAAKASSIINSHNDEIKACYHDYLKLNPNIAGKMVVRIFVNPGGSVQQVEISASTITESQFQEKLTQLIKQWKDFGFCGSNKVKVYRQEYVFGNDEE